MFSVLSRALRRFRRDERGAALLMFTLMIVPLLLVTAVAIDFSQILVVKRQLATAVDSAALTLGSLPALDDAEALTKAEAYVHAHYNETIGKLTGVTVVREEETVNVTATAKIPMTFLQVAGYDKVDIAVSSQVIRKENKLEVALVLDNTGSMMGSKIAALQAAANTLVDTLIGANDTSEYVKIGLVPFTDAVNVGSGRRGVWWLDEQKPSALNNENITKLPAGVSLFTLFDAMHKLDSKISWRGCVRARTEPYDTTSTPPDPSNSATLFTPYFAPDEASYGANDYIRTSNDQTDYQKYGHQAATITSDAYNETGPNAYCPLAALQPLSNVKATIKSAINAMRARGSTAIPEGLAWGWRVISPDAPFAQGVAYGQADTIKAIVLMTDGQNDVSQGQNSPNNSIFSAYGYVNPVKHLGTNTTQTLNAKLTAICNNIKAIKRPDGSGAVVIYTILFDANLQSIRTLLNDCASDPDHFFNSPTNADLQSAFESIAVGLNQLRVSR